MKFRSESIFGSTEMQTDDPTWRVTYPATTCPACGKPDCPDHAIRTKVDQAMDFRAEHQRLKDAVVEAARDFTKDEVVKGFDALCSYRHLCASTDALLDFESQHGITK